MSQLNLERDDAIGLTFALIKFILFKVDLNKISKAIKCMHHSRKTKLIVDDVDGALNLRNVELYLWGPLRLKRVVRHKDLFYIDDKDVELKDVIEAPLPKTPLETSVFCHWLAIDGVQLAIPKNAPIEAIAAPLDRKHEHKDDELPVKVKLLIKHVFQSDSTLFKEALVSLATDSGLHPLVPYFTCFIVDEVSCGLNDYQLLFALMRVVQSLLQNPHIHKEPCVQLGNRFADNHWELRDFTKNLVGSLGSMSSHGKFYNETTSPASYVCMKLFYHNSSPQFKNGIKGRELLIAWSNTGFLKTLLYTMITFFTRD
ncbi:hypothetical protein UlMin_027226 [Ulmus minor]